MNTLLPKDFNIQREGEKGNKLQNAPTTTYLLLPGCDQSQGQTSNLCSLMKNKLHEVLAKSLMKEAVNFFSNM